MARNSGGNIDAISGLCRYWFTSAVSAAAAKPMQALSRKPDGVSTANRGLAFLYSSSCASSEELSCALISSAMSSLVVLSAAVCSVAGSSAAPAVSGSVLATVCASTVLAS